jgi:hypothetical protein
MDYTYEFPDKAAFLHTLRKYLDTTGHADLAALLAGVTCEFSNTGQYGGGWNVYQAELTIYVPLGRVPAFTEEVCAEITRSGDKLFSPTSGFELIWTQVAPQLEAPGDDDNQPGLNSGSLVSGGAHAYDGLRFRSRTEIRLYDELKRRQVLFFPNAAAVLGDTGLKREPDFLICKNGKWGILEVMGEPFHPSATAMQDHDRARLFNDFGVSNIWFYDASRCYNTPVEVIDDFLKRLDSNS